MQNYPSSLDVEVGKLFAAFNLYTADDGKLRAQVMVWREELEEYPLWAVRIAYKWAVSNGQEMPSPAQFAMDIRLAIGSQTLKHKRRLEALVR